MAFWQWSKTAASNANSDPTMNWAEGMPPGQVNDGERAEMARLAEYRDDTSGLLLTGGTSTAYTVTTNQGLPSTPNDGQLLVVTFHAANTAAPPTLSADGGTAFPIQFVSGTPINLGAILTNQTIPLKFKASASAWTMIGAGVASFALQAATGSIFNSMLAAAAAWTLKGNPTGSSASPTDFTIDSLTAKATLVGADEVPIWDVAGSAMKKATLSSIGFGALPTVQRFTSGSANYTPAAGVTKIKVTMCGGGGGGSASATGNGGSGGSTSFGLWTCGGGSGGAANNSLGGSGGSGGANGAGTLVVRFAGGSGGAGSNGTSQVGGGIGGSNPFGGAGGGGCALTNGQSASANTGAGGGGGGVQGGGQAVGSGGGAGEYAQFWAANPGTTAYSIGAAGTAGSGIGTTGGAGAAGIIIVEEFYD